MISSTAFYDQAVAELLARGINVQNAEAEDWSKLFLQAITNTFTSIWIASFTIPGAGPNPPGTAPHTHLLVPGFFTPVTIASGITTACLASGFSTGYSWEALRDAWASALPTVLAVTITDIQDGNTPHTHVWLGFSASALKTATIQYLQLHHPEIDIYNAASKLDAYIEGISEALADTILTDGETLLPIPAGLTHTHQLA